MSVVSTHQDVEALTFSIVSELAAPPARVWQVWADVRQLERWWGPPTWPATFVTHDLTVGSRTHYFMTGPDGERAHGWWHILSVEEPVAVEFEDGFADETGAPDESMPTTRARVELTAIPQGTRMSLTTRFADAQQMAQLVEMGMVEGITGAMSQIDALVTQDAHTPA
ncbi:SRPBCC domain-containing protein [Actinotalea sp. K2]|uniref:SRPBCC family protein n=1 Tax=Actinotalea sp. K2 TaxID=2939438 RepID=UPI002017AFA0|nr:SRPBCC domain-containing protein [Actinotalea sp. K2]MCL3861243.1 SRPBCC domain-containing protein [Actinotalea sp. K2]